MELVAGTHVTPELRLSQKLGEGAMGSIWSADHLRLGRQVAVKFVAARLATENPQAFERFQREAEVLDGFSHPHVVQLFGRGRTPTGDPFIVMELLGGEPLVDRLERDGVLTMNEMTRLITQVGGALEAVHEKGIVHRDVKAENLFVQGEEGTLFAKLFDFGLAKKPNEVGAGKALTGLGMVVGTAEYMSPEQIVSSRDADKHADMWALAVVSYVSLVAGLPFRGKDLAETFGLVRNAQFERPSTIRDDVPKAVDAWFERAFHMDRSKRFGSASEMVGAWQAAASGQAGGPLAGASVALPAVHAPAYGAAHGHALAPGQPSVPGAPGGPAPFPPPLVATEGSKAPLVVAIVAGTVAVLAVVVWLLA